MARGMFKAGVGIGKTIGGGALALLATIVAALISTNPAAAQDSRPAVTVTDDGETFTLSNGLVTAVVSRRSADLLSLQYKGVETISPDSGGHSAAYWSHDVTGGVAIVPRISIDPATNGGERAEVSIKGISGGVKMGHGPGTPVEGDLAVDIDIRWSLGREDRGVYTYTAFHHPADYPGGVMAEARIAVELAPYFDRIHVDDARSGTFPLLNEGVDKYVYTALQAEERAYGWTSSAKGMGWFLLNPSAEYLSGGPTKAEFLAHGRPTVLNYWKSSHYYGANVTLVEGEEWKKVIGPFMFYVNEGTSHSAMVADAKAQLRREEGKWPFGWVDVEGYAPPSARSEVSGRLVLRTASAAEGANRFPGKLTIGLTRTPYTVPAGNGGSRTIEWQNDGKFNQHWAVSNDPVGAFVIPDVPAGQYTLHAFADGVAGEFAQAGVKVPVGGRLDLGAIEWAPAQAGRILWEIGTADRSGKEFRLGDRYFEPGVQLRFPKQFPDGMTYRIPDSQPGKDWFFSHAPTPRKGVDYEVRAFSGVVGEGDATPYRIAFNLDRKQPGVATVRLGMTSNSANKLAVTVNGTPVGHAPLAPADHAMTRHQMYGRWFETWLSFDAGLLNAGENILTLTVPSGPINGAIVYDYLRLELDEAGHAPAPPPEFALRLVLSAPPPKPVPETHEVRTALDDVRFGLPGFQVGDKRFFAKMDARDRRGIYVQQGSGRERLLVSPPRAGSGRIAEWRPSPDGTKIAYAVAESQDAGAWRTVHVWDVAAGRKLADEILWFRNSSIAWSADSAGFYYSRYRDPSPDPEVQRFNGAQEVFYHRIGEDRLKDRRVYASDRGEVIHYAETSDDGRWVVINASVKGNGRSEVILIDRTQKAPGPFKAIRTARDSWQLAGSDGDELFFVTTFGAPNRRLVALDTANASLPLRQIVPETGEVLQAVRLVGGEFHLSYAGPDGPVVKTVDAKPAR